MNEIIHAATGELIDYRPVSPVEVEFIIREIADRIERAPLILDELQRARYAAEAKYSEAFETAKIIGKASTYSDRRAEAILSCLPLQRELDEAKAKLHHAENLQDALKAKLMGYQNINKVNSAAYGAAGMGRV
jgi:hypothetical protein